MPPHLQHIPPEDLVNMNDFEGVEPISIDLVYQRADHPENIFGCALYRPGAKFWLHRDFAPIIVQAARHLARHYGAILILKDGLRTVEAQARMLETDIVRANPHWTDGPVTLLSRPGMGAHPRGMAVDVAVMDEKDGIMWDFGTVFDYLSENPAQNPAARDYPHLSDSQKSARQRLDEALMTGASLCAREILPLPAEWWDYRFPPALTALYAPLSDADLPDFMKMTNAP